MRFVVVVALLIASVAYADSGEGIVLESYTGNRPDDVNRLLAPIFDELATRGYIAGPEVVGRRFEQRVSRPNATGGLPETFGETVEKGHKAFISGRFDETVKLLVPLTDGARANPTPFAQNQPMRDKLLKALIALALSYERQGQQNAMRETFGELLRSFPDAQISRSSYGPDAVSLFEDVKKQLLSSGKGKLEIKANDGAAVFVNERFVGLGSVRTDLTPGEYRVFAQVGKVASRLYTARVVANQEASVTIDANLDAVTHTSPQWTGMVYAETAAREKFESLYAAAFANAISARGVAVIGIDNVKGKPSLVGTLVNLMNGAEVRRASIPLDPDPSVEQLKGFARFVAGDNVAPPGVDIVLAGNIKAAPTVDGTGIQIGDRPAHTRPIWGGWKYVTGGAGLLALGIGGYVLSLDGDCADDACSYQRDTKLSGWATIGGGVVLGGISVYLFLRGDGESSTRSAFVVPTHDGAYAGYAMRF